MSAMDNQIYVLLLKLNNLTALLDKKITEVQEKLNEIERRISK